MKTLLSLAVGAALGALAIVVLPRFHPFDVPGSKHASHDHASESKPEDEHDDPLKLTDEQLKAADITFAPAEGGALRRHFLVPGSIVPSADRIARVSVRLLGTVAELRKRLGDNVTRGEVVAVIESRDVADAKSE